MAFDHGLFVIINLIGNKYVFFCFFFKHNKIIELIFKEKFILLAFKGFVSPFHFQNTVN
jgi:hypothetical protein